jgi:SAM-dependent methyltransferase
VGEFKYIGSELDLFAGVHNWKSYWSAQLRPFIQGDVLEVGAGIGSNTPYLSQEASGRWLCLEPDAALVAQLTLSLEKIPAQPQYETVCGTLQSVKGRQFDTIVYIDVLEHIEKDREELETAANLLRSGGRVIVLSPAHQRLFSPFDAEIGHFRRYDRTMLRGLSPAGLRLERVWYLDSAGLILSIANRHLLRQSMPTRGQLQFWDHRVIPVSRILDRCLLRAVGKSIVGIWRRDKD